MTVNKITNPPSEKDVIDKINEVIDNLGGSGTVDQTYDGTSANAQSGIAIAGAKFVQNTATATNSLTILGTTNNQNNSILIGYSTTTSSTNSTVIGNTAVSGGSYATALGYYARANDQYTTAIGNSSYASYQDTTAVGHNSQATAAGTLAVGSNSKATAQRATSIGYSSQATQYQATALGYEAKATANSALQIGTGTNSTANTLQVGTYTLLNTSTGLIPDDRISSNIARTSAIPDVSSYLQNTATGTNSLTILGTATSYGSATNIGKNSTVTAIYGTALGYGASVSGDNAIALGVGASATRGSALQIGYGTNSTANTLNIGFYNDGSAHYNWQLLDGTTGLIPDARISSNIARTSQIPSITIDQTFDGTSANAQSGVAIEGELANYVKAEDNSAFIKNGATYVNCGYEDNDYFAELYIDDNSAYLAFNDTQNDYHSEVTVRPEGIELSYNYEGVGIVDSGNNDGVALTVSNNNLAVNGSEVVTGDNTRFDGQWVNVDQAIISSATSLNSSTNLTYRVDLPNDEHKYEVMIRGVGYTNSTAGNEIWLTITGNEDSQSRYIGRARAAQAGTFVCCGTVICTMSYVANNAKNLTLARDTTWKGSCSELKVIAYRRIGTNT